MLSDTEAGAYYDSDGEALLFELCMVIGEMNSMNAEESAIHKSEVG